MTPIILRVGLAAETLITLRGNTTGHSPAGFLCDSIPRRFTDSEISETHSDSLDLCLVTGCGKSLQ